MTYRKRDALAAQPGPSDRPQASTNPIRDLQTFGQSVWLDYVRRSSFTGGEA